jgi:hypothetical protein
MKTQSKHSNLSNDNMVVTSIVFRLDYRRDLVQESGCAIVRLIWKLTHQLEFILKWYHFNCLKNSNDDVLKRNQNNIVLDKN